MAVLQKQQQLKALLKALQQQVNERREYLSSLERDIEIATIAGADKIRELQGEIDELESERARLLRLALGYEQRIRDAKLQLE